MTPITYAEFLDRYPEFKGVPESAGSYQLEFSSRLISKSAFGKFWNDAVGLFTAHYLALRFDISDQEDEEGLNDPSSTIGVATSKSASTGGLSEGSTVSGLITGTNAIEADLARTEYGLRFLSLLRAVVPAGNIVISIDTSLAAGVEHNYRIGTL